MNWTLIGALAAIALAMLYVFRRHQAWKAANRVAAPPLIEHPSPNFSDRNVSRPTFLILHYTAMDTAQEALDRLCDPASQVSSHYLVGEDGTIWRLVAEDKKAWHAGISFWRGQRDLNQHSIGIEIANPGNRPFAEAQMVAVEQLCRWILSRHKIKAQYVLGHSDIAPGRKPDPGWFFDWKRLAAAGIGIVPAPTDQDYNKSANWGEAEAHRALTEYGYVTDIPFKTAMEAFQRHFRQEVVQSPNKLGTLDREAAARLAWLIRNKG